jgi:uncharacterized protein with HEPN domain
MMPEDPAYLRHILDAITHIENFSKGITSASSLRDHPLERAGIERMLTIIGEAAKNVSPQLRKEFPDIPWKATAGMRDKIMHHYFGGATKQCSKLSGLIFRSSNRESVQFSLKGKA